MTDHLTTKEFARRDRLATKLADLERAASKNLVAKYLARWRKRYGAELDALNAKHAAATAPKEENHGQNEAKAQYDSICAMVAALECDYDRLEELREKRDDLDDEPPQSGIKGSEIFDASDDGKELTELEEAAGDCESRDDADTRISEDALSVQVRTDWRDVGSEDDKPTHFNILLCTGGPAARIMGELNEHGEPVRAWLEYQDWGTPWTQYIGADRDTLLAYARCFNFEEG